MNELIHFYEEMGISSNVYAYGEKVIERLKERFGKSYSVFEVDGDGDAIDIKVNIRVILI